MSLHSKKKEYLKSYQENYGAVGQCNLLTGVSQKTFNTWVGEDEEFRDALETLDRSFLDLAEKKAWEKALEGNDTWLWRVLCCRGGDRWRDNTMAKTTAITGTKLVQRFELVDKVIGNDSEKKMIASKTTTTKVIGDKNNG
jgi:hypothetical protein